MEEEDQDLYSTPDLSEASFATRYVFEKYDESRRARRTDEARWLKAYKNYRGLYQRFMENEKSKVSVKLTKTKVLAANQMIGEVLFGGNKFPISIDPTPVPEGISESVHFELQPSPIPEQEKELKEGETYDQYKDRLGALEKKLSNFKGQMKDGPGTTPTQVTFHPAMVTAKKLEKKVMDSLVESHSNKNLRYTTFECCLFGTGMMSGPFSYVKSYFDPKTRSNLTKKVPQMGQISIWDYYNDPDATSMEESEFGIVVRKFTKTAMRNLKKQPGFIEDKIDEVLELDCNYTPEYWEHQMRDSNVQKPMNRYKVLEFWGWVDEESLQAFGVERPKDSSENCLVNIWVCEDKVIKVATAKEYVQLPFFRVPYELNPYSFWGIGVAENIEDSQTLMNGLWRLAIDNAIMSGSLIFDIDEDSLADGVLPKIEPGAIIRRASGAPGQAVVGIKFPNVSQETMMMADKARVFADESTGIPSYSHGQTGVMGIGRTAAGISMLMDAAGSNIKGVVKNFDDYLLAPMGKALFDWFMRWEDDEEIQGDFEVKARGTESFVASEVRSQRLLQFLQIVQNPMLAPFAKSEYLIREIAKSMELDPDKVVNNMGEAQLQAKMLQEMSAMMAPPQGGPGGGMPSADNTSGGGGGAIGIGTAPGPQEEGFTGNDQTANQQPQAV